MSIAVTGYAADIRSSALANATGIAQTSPRGNETTLDPSLAITSQVPEIEELQAVVDSFNQFIPMAAHNLTFSIDDDSGKVIVKIIDGATQNVIRQIPSEEALALSRSLDQLKGLLLTGKA